MATSTDYKNLWDRYQREGVPNKISIVRFCEMNGGVRIRHVSDSTDMRYGKYRLLLIVESKGRDPYNGDAYVFLSNLFVRYGT